jgi:hypothetical protein
VLDSEVPYRVYKIGKRKGVRFTFRQGATEYWGIQMTDWEDAPALEDANTTEVIKGRKYSLYYDGTEPAHGGAPPRRGDLLGREHGAQQAFERDHARDRQGPLPVQKVESRA